MIFDGGGEGDVDGDGDGWKGRESPRRWHLGGDGRLGLVWERSVVF